MSDQPLAPTPAANRMPPCPCPFCGKVLDAASAVDGGPAEPAPGDMTLCIYCAQVLILSDDTTPRRPHTGELEAAFAADPSAAGAVRRAQHAIRRIDRTGLD